MSFLISSGSLTGKSKNKDDEENDKAKKALSEPKEVKQPTRRNKSPSQGGNSAVGQSHSAGPLKGIFAIDAKDKVR